MNFSLFMPLSIYQFMNWPEKKISNSKKLDLHKILFAWSLSMNSQRGYRTHDPEINSFMLYRLSQLGETQVPVNRNFERRFLLFIKRVCAYNNNNNVTCKVKLN